MVTRPRDGLSESSSRRSRLVLPEREGPVRKWNEPGSTEKVRSRRISGPLP
ncbi:hypothetical protein D3C72_2504880 [compost metagenome]